MGEGVRLALEADAEHLLWRRGPARWRSLHIPSQRHPLPERVALVPVPVVEMRPRRVPRMTAPIQMTMMVQRLFRRRERRGPRTPVLDSIDAGVPCFICLFY